MPSCRCSSRRAGLVNLGALEGRLAHELANALSTLSLQAEMLEREALEDRPARGQALQRTLERMGNILEAMRGGVRFAGGERRAVDLETELELAVTLAEGRLRNKVEVRRDEGGNGLGLWISRSPSSTAAHSPSRRAKAAAPASEYGCPKVRTGSGRARRCPARSLAVAGEEAH